MKHQIGDLVWLRDGGWEKHPLLVVGYTEEYIEVLWITSKSVYSNKTLTFPSSMLHPYPQERQ